MAMSTNQPTRGPIIHPLLRNEASLKAYRMCTPSRLRSSFSLLEFLQSKQSPSRGLDKRRQSVSSVQPCHDSDLNWQRLLRIQDKRQAGSINLARTECNDFKRTQTELEVYIQHSARTTIGLANRG